MANTTNLNLARPEPTENWSVQNHFNANMQKIDEFAGNANRAVITNQYSNIVDAINAFRTVKTFPFTIQKNGSASYGGLPSGVSATCEWNALCIGDAQRLTVILIIYTGASSNNQTVWEENIYNGAVNMSWQQLITSNVSNWSSCSDYKASIESSANVVMQMFGKVRMLTFQGVGRTHTEDELLMTLPAEHRPVGSTNVYSAGNIGSTPVTVRLNGSDGRVTLFIANSTTANARLYFQMTWIAA